MGYVTLTVQWNKLSSSLTRHFLRWGWAAPPGKPWASFQKSPALNLFTMMSWPSLELHPNCPAHRSQSQTGPDTMHNTIWARTHTQLRNTAHEWTPMTIQPSCKLQVHFLSANLTFKCSVPANNVSSIKKCMCICKMGRWMSNWLDRKYIIQTMQSILPWHLG